MEPGMLVNPLLAGKFRSVEPSLGGDTRRHAEIEVPRVAVRKDKERNSLVHSISKKLLFTRNVRSANPFSFNEYQWCPLLPNEGVVHSTIIHGILRPELHRVSVVPIKSVKDWQDNGLLHLRFILK